jgi:SAM-dependent methyltransferase
MFYSDVLAKLLATGQIGKSDSVLVVCGGPMDRQTLLDLGFENVTISNLDDRIGNLFEPYRWNRQDAEHLTYDDGAFDVTLVHAGLHHCHSPHRALIEMYRVARKCAIAFEARDSLLMRTAIRFGLTDDFELEAVSGDNFARGGVANGPIPNFIYRWTEREIRKTVESYEPQYQHSYSFHYGFRAPTSRLAGTQRLVKRLAIAAIAPAMKVFTAIAPKQANEFGFVISRGPLKPWMENPHRLSKDYAQRTGHLYVYPGKRTVEEAPY